MYSDNIAKGRAKMLAQPIPAMPISTIIAFGLAVNVIKRYAAAIIKSEITCTFLFPYFVDKTPIGMETRKHTRFSTAKQIEEKFVA